MDERLRNLRRRAKAGDEDARLELREFQAAAGVEARFFLLKEESGSSDVVDGARKVRVLYRDSRRGWLDRPSNAWATPLRDLEELAEALRTSSSSAGTTFVYDADEGELLALGTRRRRCDLVAGWTTPDAGDAGEPMSPEPTEPRQQARGLLVATGDQTVRQRVLDAYGRGLSIADVAAELGVSPEEAFRQAYPQSAGATEAVRSGGTDAEMRQLERQVSAGEMYALDRLSVLRRRSGIDRPSG